MTDYERSSSSSGVEYSFEDERVWRRLSALLYRAYDTKNWALLGSISAPEISLLYSGLSPTLPDRTISKEQLIAEFSKRSVLGDERLQTSHLLGEGIFTLHDPESATADWQAYVRHLRTFADGRTAEWSAASTVKLLLAKYDGEWKVAGVQPSPVHFEVGKIQDVIGDFP